MDAFWLSFCVLFQRLVSEDRNSDKESSIDMEISWEPGLKDIGKKIESKKTSESGTAWEKYLEERKKKKKEKRMQFEKAKGTEKETSEDNEEYSKEVSCSMQFVGIVGLAYIHSYMYYVLEYLHMYIYTYMQYVCMYECTYMGVHTIA